MLEGRCCGAGCVIDGEILLDRSHFTVRASRSTSSATRFPPLGGSWPVSSLDCLDLQHPHERRLVLLVERHNGPDFTPIEDAERAREDALQGERRALCERPWSRGLALWPPRCAAVAERFAQGPLLTFGWCGG
jgi:hypothetical protein